MSADEEIDRDRDWFILRTKLWRVLGYGHDRLIHDNMQYMWQNNLQIGSIGSHSGEHWIAS